MPKPIIKVYFNNGCTTLMYNDLTTAEDIIKVVIKGRLSLNELRYKQCFKLRSTKFSLPFKDFDPLFTSSSDNKSSNETSSSSSSNQVLKIEDYFWLRNSSTIKEWLNLIGQTDENSNAIDYWKLQLRIRYLSTDLNEIKFKDPVTFNYYYEQIKNDFIQNKALNINDQDLLPVLLDLGCLEMRRSFQNMNPNVLDKKINYEYLEKDVGLKRFFPDLVLQQKAKNLKKMIIKGLKAYENFNETECMLKYLEKLLNLWKYNEETYKCHLGSTWGVPVLVIINHDSGISCKMNNSKEVFQNIKYNNILEINTELDENQTDGLLKLKITEAKELLIFKFSSLKEAESMASIIDGYCCLSNNKKDSIWTSSVSSKRSSDLSQNSESRKSSEKSFTDETNEIKKAFKPKKNSVHILSESEDMATSESSIETSSLNDSKSDFLTVDSMKLNHVPIDSLVLHEKLGSGQFGEVYRGTYKKNPSQTIEVGIKKLKITDSIDDLDSTEHEMITKRFIREAKIMQNFDHPHIIKLIGVCFNGPLAIVMELAKFGQLRTYLQNNRNQLETATLLLYCYQLNSAMAYLESKKHVHRDIAARNILVFNHECIKLADFGLSREIDENIYLASKCKLPIKWMAPESINFRKFTTQSDVWMFGICLWEIMSYGEKPFQGIKNPDVIKLIEDKHRLEKPDGCPDELYYIMLKCWEYDSSLRPNFFQLKESTNAIYTNYKDNKRGNIHQSLSNGSSLLSNSSLSSTVSSGTMLSMIMGYEKNKSPNASVHININTSKYSAMNSTSSPPPKPNRINLNKINDFSPTRSNSAQRRNQQHPFKNNNQTSFDADDRELMKSNDISISNKFPYENSYVSSSSSSSYNQIMKSNDLNNKMNLSDNMSNDIVNESSYLDENFKKMELSPKKDSKFVSPTLTSTNNNSINKKDLILRDLTLKFIQTISVFIKYLNGDDNQKLDAELKEIIQSLKHLIETIESIELYSKSEKINEQVDELEKCLNTMIYELNMNRIEKVINSALDMARTANELFLTITNKSRINS